MRPRKNGEQVPPERMIPSRPKCSQNAPHRFEKLAHPLQYQRRVIEMFKGIYCGNDIRSFGGFKSKSTSFCNAFCNCPPLCHLYHSLLDIHANDSPCASPDHVDGFSPLATSEINHHLVGNFIPDSRAPMRCELALIKVGGLIHQTSNADRTYPLEYSISSFSTDHGHFCTAPMSA